MSKESLAATFKRDERLRKLLTDPVFTREVKEFALIPVHERKAKILHLLEVYPDFTYFADCLRPEELGA